MDHELGVAITAFIVLMAPFLIGSITALTMGYANNLRAASGMAFSHHTDPAAQQWHAQNNAAQVRSRKNQLRWGIGGPLIGIIGLIVVFANNWSLF